MRCNGLTRPNLLTPEPEGEPLAALRFGTGGSGRIFGPDAAPGFHRPRLALSTLSDLTLPVVACKGFCILKEPTCQVRTPRGGDERAAEGRRMIR